MDIPIQNVYYMLSYAWKAWNEAGLLKVEAQEFQSADDFFALLLVRGTEMLLKKGLYRSYKDSTEEISSLRGRIDFTQSTSHFTWLKGRMVCEVSDASYDCLPNQILKATLKSLLKRGIEILRAGNLRKEDRERKDQQIKDLARLVRRLEEVQDIPLTKSAFSHIRLGPNFRFYRFILHLCEFLYSQQLPQKSTDGHRQFWDFLEEDKMSSLFEAFVRNFYGKELPSPNYRVSNSTFRWQDIQGDTDILPVMKTDVEIEDKSRGRLIVLDCKYYMKALYEAYSQSKDTDAKQLKIHSEHLYQIYAYLKNKELKDPYHRWVDGILLYPQVGEPFSYDVDLQGHRIQFASINLDQPWPDIKQALLELIETQPARAKATA